MSNVGINITYNHEKNTKRYSFFKGCVTDSDENTNSVVDKNVCQFSPKIQDPNYLTFTNSQKRQKLMYLDKHYVYQFPTIAGDSGSPVFNEKFELIGMVTGRKNDPKDITKTLWAHVTPIESLKKYVNSK